MLFQSAHPFLWPAITRFESQSFFNIFSSVPAASLHSTESHFALDLNLSYTRVASFTTTSLETRCAKNNVKRRGKKKRRVGKACGCSLLLRKWKPIHSRVMLRLYRSISGKKIQLCTKEGIFEVVFVTGLLSLFPQRSLHASVVWGLLFLSNMKLLALQGLLRC